MCNVSKYLYTDRVYLLLSPTEIQGTRVLFRDTDKKVVGIIFAEYKIGQTCQKLSDVCQEKRLQGHEMETEYLNIM